MGTRNMTEREWLECTDPENMWICRKLWISRKNKPSDRRRFGYSHVRVVGGFGICLPMNGAEKPWKWPKSMPMVW